MLNVTSVDVNARACCSWLDEVWVAKQQGGLQIFNSTTNEPIKDIKVPLDGVENVQLSALIPVLDEIWTATLDGKLLVISAASRSIVSTIRLPGEEKKAALTDLHFNGYMVLVASETGRVFIVHPISQKQIGVLTAHAPCTAVTTFYSFILTGDREGRLYLWDGITGECLAEHDKSKSEVLRVFHEITTGSIWVARKNGNLDLYTVSADQIALVARVPALGRVTGLVGVSGNIVVSTFEKKLFILCAQTGKILQELKNVHSSFLHGVTKVQQQERAVLWTFANDAGAKVWEIDGAFVPAYIAPHKSPHEVAQMAVRQPLAQISENAALGVKVQEERKKGVDMAGDLRAAREEAQEVRLKLLKVEEQAHVAKQEVLKLQTRVKELEEEQRPTQKSLTDEQQKNVSEGHERTMLQSEVSTLKEDLSKARTDASNRLEELSKKSQEVSTAKLEKSQFEQRLQDTEGKLATVQAENARLCRSMGSIAVSQSAEKEVQNQIISDSAKVRDEVERLHRLNRMMSSAVASMVYTIRQKEEEECDMTALLNAYRRKVADRVADPHLAALLLATMVRAPSRFELECDDVTKAELLDRNGPFIQFIHSLRDTDPEAYDKLMLYLQQSSTGVLPPEADDLLNRFLSLATSEGNVSGEFLNTFKRSMPTPMDATTAAATAAGFASSADAAGRPSDNQSSVTNITWRGVQGEGAADLPPYLRAVGPDKGEDDLLNGALLREIRSQKGVDENYVKEHQTLFEFILKTRRSLVECLALLQKRTFSARQVVDALVVGGSSSPIKNAQPLQSIFTGIIQELVELSTSIVTKFFTNAEKQRFNIQ